MKRCSITLALAISCAAMAAASTPHVPGELLVKFTPAGAALSQTYHRQIGAVQVGTIDSIGVQRVKLPAGVTAEQAVSYYNRLAAVDYAETNIILQKDASVNDPLYSRQYSVPRMNVNTSWDLTFGNDKVVVAVLDTGVDYNHVDLSGKVTKGHDWADNDEDPMDLEGHGTHVAGTIGAKTNNGVGVAGIGYNVSILAIRVLGIGGGTAEWVAGGITEATDKGADIINMSLGSASPSQAIEDAVNYAWSKGVVVVAAAGNDGSTSKHYPGAFEKVICVGASDKDDARAGFSNYGADWVDVAGPGVGVLSTVPGNSYQEYDGTSMASPNVAGVASLVISYGEKGQITNQEVRDILESTAVPVGNWVSKGRVNAYAAVSIAVPPIIDNRAPATARMFDGSTYTGTAANLATNDGVGFNVASRYVTQLGGVAGPEMGFAYNYPASRWLSGKFKFRSKGPIGSTATVYLKRNDGTYATLKSFPISGSYITQTAGLPSNITPYLNAGKITMVVRAVLPYRYGSQTFTYSMDSASMETRTSSKTVTP
ncbi:MAG: S8 family peptidase [Fimbriimonas sp.]